MQDLSEGEKEFRGLAVAKHVILPDTISNQQKKEHDDLQKKTGTSFDKAYIDLMIKDHKDDVDEYQKASQHANDSDVRALALKLLPLLQAHLDTVQAIQKANKS
jgi:putative membrane protein